ncbi:hypothetical protein MRB53_039849 [Persea americana]|nr:hypothetical protein MRB53_039849 [Persea americana]
MATKLATGQPAMVAGQHSAGIFADMTVDGPVIGTLVVIVDRAKNLPSRKSMGKQNPYCAARLGKEANKTDTDKRGGQTPKWDQELRFTVHDSLDYHNLKVSVFSEDKKTDLIGEAWVKLDSVITAGGGKSDLWQTLNCKGKYAGEIRIELTYYDSRPKPEKKSTPQLDDALSRQISAEKVKRRPLPGGSRAPLTPDTIPEPLAPGRARHGPRDFRTPPRANSMPPETIPTHTPVQPDLRYQQDVYGSSPSARDQDLPIPIHAEYQDKYSVEEYDQYSQPDFLPTLPPLAPRQRMTTQQERFAPAQKQMRAWQDQQVSPQHYTDEYDTPPRPPNHSRSTSALPSPYSPVSPVSPEHNMSRLPEISQMRPVSRGQQYISNSSPLQTIERSYDQYQSSPLQPRRAPDGRPLMSDIESPPRRAPDGRPIMNDMDTFRTSPGRNHPSQPRQSFGAVPQQYRQQPHPLSQEMPHEREQIHPTSAAEVDRYRNDLDRNAITPIIRPRAISPARQAPEAQRQEPERRRKSVYSIQNPVRAFESSDLNPLSHSRSDSQVNNLSGRPGFPEKTVITGWDGREIDPSDHLPIASWAPEPESKGQNKAYGLGRDRDFGPRTEQNNNNRLGKDVVVNVHRRGQSVDATQSSTIKARLVKKSAPASSPIQPLREHPNYNPIPDPYAQQEYSHHFANSSPDGMQSRYDEYPQSYNAPNLPPKVPLGHGRDALSREIASIDLGAGSRARAAAPTAYVPVRSHRDRNSFY